MSTSNSRALLRASAVGVTALVAAAAAAFVGWRAMRSHSPSSPSVSTARGVPASQAPTKAEPRVPGEPLVESAERARAMELLGLLKQRANVAFQEGRYEDAVRGYQDCISVTNALGSHDAEAVSAEQVIRSNVVMALIKLQQYEDARLVATMLLQDADAPLSGDLQVKVLYRRGMASKALGDCDAAVSDFHAAVQLSPAHTNPAAEKELALLKKTT